MRAGLQRSIIDIEYTTDSRNTLNEKTQWQALYKKVRARKIYKSSTELHERSGQIGKQTVVFKIRSYYLEGLTMHHRIVERGGAVFDIVGINPNNQFRGEIEVECVELSRQAISGL